MWFSGRIKEVVDVDIAELLQAMEKIDESLWDADEYVKQKLAGDRPTRSLFYYSIDHSDFARLLGQRPLTQNDVPRLAAYHALCEPINKILEIVQQHYPPGGVFLRVQLARMMPGSKIDKHRDVYPILENSHRLHVPIITSKKLKFVVDDEDVKLITGKLYELNNVLEHWVENPSDGTPRVHLIMDYLPPEHNHPEALNENFKFKIKKARSVHKKTSANLSLALPNLVVTSVVRGANQNESHGGVYLVDMEKDKVQQVMDWNTCDIDFSGRGWDRGLRGISIAKDLVIIAASDELFFYNKKFRQIGSFKNPYLRHAHEIFLDGRFLYVTSTGFDAVLRFDLKKKIFDLGYKLFIRLDQKIGVKQFDPQQKEQIKESIIFHINNVFTRQNQIYVSGRKVGELLRLGEDLVISVAQLPLGTHNAMFAGKALIYNDTESDQVVYSTNYEYRDIAVKNYDSELIQNLDLGDLQLARPGFGRGLCLYKNGTVVAGSSPSTVSLMDFKSQSILKSVNISMDVRNAVHGLEIWPF